MAAFIIANVVCVLGGWVLSAFHAFNTAGYWVLLALGATYAVRARVPIRVRWRRVDSSLPFLFFFIAALSLVGGILHPPSQFDALTYRLPRILHWWSESRMHWISTPNARMNYSAAGQELAMAPLLIGTRSDRGLFALNLIAFLLLPGALFSVLRMLGTSGRVAWNWMWLFPCGYCFAMQAGGVGNDAYGATLVLGSLQYGLKARESRRWEHLALCILAAALATGIKASNLPLLLPLGWVALPSARLLIQPWWRSGALAAVALAVSFVPVAIANQWFAGHWTGDATNSSQLRAGDGVSAMLGNSLQLLSKCLETPVLPKASALEDRVTQTLPEWVRTRLSKGFPRFALGFSELPQEENSGLGIGVSILLVAAFLSRRKAEFAAHAGLYVTILIAFLAFMVSMGSESTGRLLAPYYPLLAIPFMRSLSLEVTRARWWRWVAVVCAGSVILPLLITPSRPIVPPAGLLAAVRGAGASEDLIARTESVYTAYGKRHDLLGDLRHAIPANETRVAVVLTADTPELSLWMPYGERVVTNPGVDDAGSPRWWVISQAEWEERHWPPLREWVSARGGVVRMESDVVTYVRKGPGHWVVVQLP